MKPKAKGKKENILIFLKDNPQSSTGRIASEIKSDQFRAERYLKELEDENKVEKTKVPNATYWRTKNK